MQIGRRPYKSDRKSEQTLEHLEARRDLLGVLLEAACRGTYGFDLQAPIALADDPSGDELDALLSAIQATWGYTQRDHG